MQTGAKNPGFPACVSPDKLKQIVGKHQEGDSLYSTQQEDHGVVAWARVQSVLVFVKLSESLHRHISAAKLQNINLLFAAECTDSDGAVTPSGLRHMIASLRTDPLEYFTTLSAGWRMICEMISQYFPVITWCRRHWRHRWFWRSVYFLWHAGW